MALFSFFRTTAVSAALLALLSIMNPPPATAADQWANLPFAVGWTNYANGYRPVSVAKSGHIVTLSGLARKTDGGAWGHIATLPAGMRPSQRLIFNVNTHDSTARVDVLPGGEVFFVTGNTGYGWVSLDGISFSMDRSHALPLTSGWQNYGDGYAPAGTIRAGETVIVNGLVKPGAGSLIATLPAHLRPTKRLIFNLNSHDKTARVDVLPNGQIVWVYRAPARGWISLNGITFERKPGQALQLVNGWQHYQDGYAPATATRVGNRINVSGLLRSGNWGGHIATLPRGMCPKERLIFNLNNHERTSRVDVMPDCRIVWAAGGTDHGWLSLDGISFVLNQAGAPVAQTPSTPQDSGPSAADADKVFHAYPKYRNVRVNWSRSGNALIGSARIGNSNATVVAYKPQGKPSVSVGIVMPSASIQDVLANIAGNNPMKSYRLQNVVAFLVPPGNQNNAQRIAELPGPLANAARQARLEDGFALNVGLSYFGILNVNINPIITQALNTMGVGNPWTVSGGIVHTAFEAPQHSITVTAPLKQNPLTRIFGSAFQVVRQSSKARPSVFLTATGTNKITVGYTSTFDVFGQTVDGTLEFTTERAGETEVKLTMLRGGAWQNPHFGPMGVSNVALHDTTVVLSYSRDRTGTKATVGLYPKKTVVHSTVYTPSSFSLTVDGATGYPKAAFVDLATSTLTIRQLAELQDIALQLTPQGQLARHGNPYRRGVAVANALGLGNLPIDAIKLASPKIYLATPGAAQPEGAAAPYPPLPEIAGAGVHARGRLETFGRTFGSAEAQFDYKGLHMDTGIQALPFGAFTLQNPRFKLDAKTGSAPKARFTGSVKIGPVPISSAEIGIGKNSFGYAFSTSCFGAVRIRSSGNSSGFAFKFNAVNPEPCLVDPLKLANDIKNTAIEVANVTQQEFNEQKKVVENEMKKIGKKAEKAAKFVANSFSKIFGKKKKKKKKPDPPSHEELVNLSCGRGELPGYILWQGSCQLNWVDTMKGVDFVGEKAVIRQSSTDLGTCAIKTELDTSTKGEKVSVFGKTAYLPVFKTTSVNGRCFETYANNRVLDDSTMTQIQQNPWWEADLKRDMLINSIAVYAPLGRADMLDGLIVAISDTVSGDNLMKDDSGAVRRYKLGAGAMAVVSPQNKFVPPTTVIPLYARYMRIYRPGRSIVALGEVQVFGVVKR